LFSNLREHKHAGETLERWLRRTEIDWADLCAMHPPLNGPIGPQGPISPLEWQAVVEQVVLESKYAGYIGRQAEQVARFQKMESRPIPAAFDYAAIPQLRFEAREKLSKIRPANIGQAGRVSGITPADLAVLLLYLG
jgi:tRNA uridine 5-carboxymethylaminomethyl modification enzyme